MYSSAVNPHIVCLGFRRAVRYPASASRFRANYLYCGFKRSCKPCKLRGSTISIRVIDDNFTDIPSLTEDDNNFSEELTTNYPSSSEGEESDDDLYVYPYMDIDVPLNNNNNNEDKLELPDATLPVAARRLTGFNRGHKRGRNRAGIVLNIWLITFISIFLLWFDCYSWRIVRLPLNPFFLTQPFTISAILSLFSGFLYIPLLDKLKIRQITRRKNSPSAHYTRREKPTMGGFFFIPIGITVARFIVGDSSDLVNGAAMVTLAFGLIGLVDDLVSLIRRRNYRLPGWLKLSLQIAVSASFSLWLDSSIMSTPYKMKYWAPLPPPVGLMYLGKMYFALTTICFTVMGNGVELTDGIDGLAGGTAALAFLGISMAVLALSPELAVFSVSMAGSCIGFLFHNRYRSSVFMGCTGALALGGALASIASCSGMFFPLFIASGIFVTELLSVIIQVLYWMIAKRVYGFRAHLFRVAPIHYYFELCGFKVPFIVGCAYLISFVLALLAGYVGLISA